MQVYPFPQKVRCGNGDFLTPKRVALDRPAEFDPDARRVLGESFLPDIHARFKVKWRKDPSLPKEGYTLILRANEVLLSASEGRGFFYAVQTLRQLLASKRFSPVAIKDWPAIPFRGSVEGFYGKPWSFEARKSQFRFYGQVKMNTYIYGPKDDPFHGFSNRWREPYPPAEAAKIAELVKVARENKVNFVWAVHPGRDIQWRDDSDIRACIAKFEKMYDLGVRSFAVFFDDIGGEGARAEKQVQLLNTVNREFVRKRGDVTPLLLCPTQYNRAWSGGNYLETLGKGLDPDVGVMWTGNSVCCDITRESMEWINARLGRKAYIWWNWPVNDFCRSNLLLGRAYGCSPENGPLYAGFVSNPMDRPEASKIGLFGVADYAWNPVKHDPEGAWRAGIRRLFPECAEAVQTFADHNSDQGPNGHGYRRLESEAWQERVERLSAELKAGEIRQTDDLLALKGEFLRMADAGRGIKARCGNPLFLEEVSAWLDLFIRQGELGAVLVDGLVGRVEAERALSAELAFRAEKRRILSRYLATADPTAQRWQKDIRVASRVMRPFTELCVKALRPRLWRAVTGKEAPRSTAKVYSLVTNVEGLRSFRVNRNGPYVELQQILEPKTLKPGEWVGISLPEGVPATWVHFVLDNPAAAKQGRIELSSDGGKSWRPRPMVVSGNGGRGELEIRRLREAEGITSARYINTSPAPLTVTFKRFKVDVPAGATANLPVSMTDGDFESGYTLPSGREVHVPLASPVSPENTKVLADGPVEKRYRPDALILRADREGVRVHEIVP